MINIKPMMMSTPSPLAMIISPLIEGALAEEVAGAVPDPDGLVPPDNCAIAWVGIGVGVGRSRVGAIVGPA